MECCQILMWPGWHVIGYAHCSHVAYAFDVYGRLVKLLLDLAVELDGKLVVPEKLTQQDIAERIGASRDMISRLLKDLVAGGYLTIQDRTITILKKPPPGW